MGRYLLKNLYASEYDSGSYERAGTFGRTDGAGRRTNGTCPGSKSAERKVGPDFLIMVLDC